VTLNPYLGRDSVQPFLDRADKGVILLCRTSNPGGADFQDLAVHDGVGRSLPLYQHIAATIARDWNAHGTGLIVSSSRAILYADGGPELGEAARGAATALRDAINRHRPRAAPRS
jgi:orotidine-5'-phosphate decarboxylase